MSSEVSEQELYRLATNRVEEKKGFYIHFAVYLDVNALLVVIWFVTGHPGDRFSWFVFPLGGWGLGVLFHFLRVFVFLFSVIATHRQYRLAGLYSKSRCAICNHFSTMVETIYPALCLSHNCCLAPAKPEDTTCYHHCQRSDKRFHLNA